MLTVTLAACVERTPATVVIVPPTAIPTKLPVATRPPTQAPTPLPSATLAASPAPSATPEGTGGGGEGETVLVIDFNASPAKVHVLNSATGDELQAFDAPGLTNLSAYTVGGQFVFFYDQDAKVVKRLGFDGAITDLPFVNSGTDSFDVKFLPSPDGSQIAWGTSAFDPNNGNATHVTLNIANTDGSNQKTVLDKVIQNQSILPQPLQWSPDGGQLYFTDEPYGIGGYILFGGGPDLQRVDVANGTVTPILPDASCLCAMSVSPDGSTVAAITGSGSLTFVLHDIATGAERKTPIDPGHLQAGDILWSADQKSVVYTMAISNFDNPDQEKYAVVQVDTATLAQKVLVPDDPRLLTTALWPDSNLIWLNDKDFNVWLMMPDSGELKPVAQKGSLVTNR